MKRTRKHLISILLIIVLTIILFSNCTKEIPKTVPTLTTTIVSNITPTTLTTGGQISSDGNSSITARGVCWSTQVNPSISDSKTSDGTGKENFTSVITGLKPGETYNIVAYATNSIATSYGNQVTAKTLSLMPSIATKPVYLIKTTTAAGAGNISSDGGALIIASGLCWSTNQNPTTLNSKTSAGPNGGSTGDYIGELRDLIANTTYYVRAYATNSEGTSYGSQVTFTTLDYPNCGTVTDIDGNSYKTVTIGTQCWLRENLKTTKFNDGITIPNETDNNKWSAIKSSAYCWYNNDSNNKPTYGALYNWYTVNTGKLCPTGWHVPSNDDWAVLISFLGGELAAGLQMKEEGNLHWISPNLATNSTGFTALPAGSRLSNTGNFGGLTGNTTNNTTYWGSPMTQDVIATKFLTNFLGSLSNKGTVYFGDGYSVRCLKN